MTVSGLNLVSSSNNTAGTSFATSSISPTSNNLVLLSFLVRNAVSVDPVTPTVTGAGLTWVEVNSSLYDPDSSTRRKLFVFRALGASPSTGALTIDFGAVTHTNITYAIDEFSGVDTSGTNGSGAIVQSGHNEVTDGTVSTLTVTLSAFSNLGNATFGAFAANNDSNTTTAGTGFTKLGDVLDSGRLMTEFRSDNDTTVNFTLSTTSDLGGVAVEIKPAPLTTSWTVSAQIKADNTKVSGASDLTNFPVLIKDGNIPASIYSAMLASGADLRITTDSAGTTEIPFEIVSITPGSSLAEVWAKIPTLLTASDTSIYLWSGNASAIAYDANAPFGSQAVWSSEYKRVLHLQEAVNNDASGYKDSTANAGHGTGTSMALTAPAGQIGIAQDFDGSADYITLTDHADFEQATGSLSFWFKPDATLNSGLGRIYYLIDKGNTYLGVRITNAGGSEGKLDFILYDGSTHRVLTTQASWTGGTWYHFTGTWGASGMKVFINGAADGTDAHTGGYTNVADNIILADNASTATNWDGKLDEWRFISAQKTGDWIATEYNNQNSPSTFWSEVSANTVRMLGLTGVGS